jgi:hypothetical protein
MKMTGLAPKMAGDVVKKPAVLPKMLSEIRNMPGEAPKMLGKLPKFAAKLRRGPAMS